MENKFAAADFEKLDFAGGVFYRATHKRFAALRGLAVQRLKLKPGAIREPHSHPNAEQPTIVSLVKHRSVSLDRRVTSSSWISGRAIFRSFREGISIGFEIRARMS